MLRFIRQASPPSARNHLALVFAPASLSRTLSGTPVHSVLLSSPPTFCGVMSGLGSRYAARPLPEHSMKYCRVTCGKRLISSMVSISGVCTSPWISSVCRDGSMLGTPAWWRSKCRSAGVMVPVRSCSGVSELPTVSPVGVRDGL